jgi:heme A synthase
MFQRIFSRIGLIVVVASILSAGFAASGDAILTDNLPPSDSQRRIESGLSRADLTSVHPE